MHAVATAESKGDSRTYRTTVSRRVSHVLEQLLSIRAVERLELGKVRLGRMTHRIHWQRSRDYRFVLDFDAGAVTIPSLSPGTAPQQLLQDLKTFLRPATAGERTLLDPEKGELRMFIKHGSLTLCIIVHKDAYEYCTEYLVNLANEVLSASVGQGDLDDRRDAS